MVYQGSKNRIASDIVPILQREIDENHLSLYMEPFVGGANIIDKIRCEERIGADKNKYLIALFNKGKENPNFIDYLPYPDKELWEEAKKLYRTQTSSKDFPEYLIGAIGFFWSYSARGFAGGFAPFGTKENRLEFEERIKNFQRQISNPNFKEIIFINSDFTRFLPRNALIYCDPPYQGTKPYGYAFESQFDYDTYWDWVREMSKDNIVICSEYNFPEDFKIIWSKELNKTLSTNNKKSGIEKLGTLNILSFM